MVNELTGQANTRNIKLTRKAGLIGMVQVSWKVNTFLMIPSLAHFQSFLQFIVVHVIVMNVLICDSLSRWHVFCSAVL